MKNKFHPVFAMVCILLMTGFSSYSQQTYDPYQIIELKKSFHPKKNSLFTLVKNKYPKEIQVLDYTISKSKLKHWLQNTEAILETKIELPVLGEADFLLTEYDFFDPDFKVYTLCNGVQSEIEIQKGKHFKAIRINQPNSYMDLSVFATEVKAFYTGFNGESVSLESNGNAKDMLMCKAMYELKNQSTTTNFDCHTDDVLHYLNNESEIQYRTTESCKQVSISIRADYELFLRFGKSTQAVSNYITGLFNQISTIYKREDIKIGLAEIIIHTSPDGFPTTSSTLALDYFRRNYTNYYGDIHLCLSGVLKNGKASLGGIAYINALCVRQYSYAYVNVNATYYSLPNFSFDVYATAHEIGHILGSRHTHACVWGPNKNQALDNCAKVEGSCLPGKRPVKGTLMSYCHVAGQPGIDLSLGFGPEPGNIIRNTVGKASCMSAYSPLIKSIQYKDAHLSANIQCSDAEFTHYYYDNNTLTTEDDVMLMSIQTSGQNIGSLHDGSLKILCHTTPSYGTKATAVSGKYQIPGYNYFASNKYWEIISTTQPRLPLKVKIYFNQTDLEELEKVNPDFDISAMHLFTIQYPGSANPENGHKNVETKHYTEYKKADIPTTQQFTFKNEADQFAIELLISNLSSISAGTKVRVQTNPNPTSKTLVEYNTIRARRFGTYQNITWTTSKERETDYFVISKSINGISFDSIGFVKAVNHSDIIRSYSINDFKISNEAFYRITLVGLDGSKHLSPIVSLSSSYAATNRLSLYPNPLGYSDLNIEYNQSIPNPINTIVNVLDPSFQKVKSYTFLTDFGKNYLRIGSDELYHPYYFIQLISQGESITQKIVVKK
ncbi:MAG: hypothetical protein IPM48_12375 [Saprospiraceae bacterium]|nr:hypothetical protein [Saprospiraceae bacterium]